MCLAIVYVPFHMFLLFYQSLAHALPQYQFSFENQVYLLLLILLALDLTHRSPGMVKVLRTRF